MNNRFSCSVLNFIYRPLNDWELIETSLAGMEVISQGGFKQVEPYFRRADPEVFEKIGTKARALGLSIPTVHFSKPLLERGIERALELLPTFIELAAGLGARMGVIHPPIKNGYCRGVQETIRVLEAVAPLALRNNFVISLETVPICNADLFLAEIISCFSPQVVQVTLDLKFQAATGIPLEHFFETLAERITNIHINDYAGKMKDKQGCRIYSQLGQGKIDFAWVALVLKHYHYQGLLTLETCLQGFDNRLYGLLQAKEILKELGEL